MAVCAGLVGTAATPAHAAWRPPEYMQIIAHPDDDLLFMAPDLSHDIAHGAGVTTVVLTSGEGHAGIWPDTHSALAYVADRRQGLEAAYAQMAGVGDVWRTTAVRSGRVTIELRTLTARPEIRLAYLSLPDGRDPRANIGRRAVAQLYADRADLICARTVTPPRSRYAGCYTHADVLHALITLLREAAPTVVRAQDPAPDPRYTADHTDHVATAEFAAEAVHGYGQPVIMTYYRDYDLSDTPVNLTPADVSTKERDFATYRAHDYRISPEARNFSSWQKRMRYRWPRGAAWTTRTATGRLQTFAVLSGRLYTWWQTPTGWAGPASLGGGSLAPSLATAGGRVFALRGHTLVVARPRLAQGHWTATWTTLATGATGAPAAVTGPGGRTVVFTRDATGAVTVTCERPGGAWTSGWQRLPGRASRPAVPSTSTPPARPGGAATPSVQTPGTPRRPASPTPRRTPGPITVPLPIPTATTPAPTGPAPVGPTGGPTATPTTATPPAPHTARPGTRAKKPAKRTARPPRHASLPPVRDAQDGMDAVGGVQGVELFAPTRTQVLQWRQTGPCSFAYAGPVPGVRPGGPVTVIRDASGHPTLFYDQAGSPAIRQAQEIGRTWSLPATPLRAVFHAPGEPPVPAGSRVPAPALPASPAGVPTVATDGTGRVFALALATDGHLYVSARDTAGGYGMWTSVG